MNKKTLAGALLVVGILLLAVSLAADAFGIGADPGFGWKQLLGAVVGAVMTAVGALNLRGNSN